MEPDTRVPVPMMTGPTIRDPLTSPASTTTRPMSSLASTVPRTCGSMVSSTIRFTSSMSATLPVSFQYPVIVVDRDLAALVDEPLDGLGRRARPATTARAATPPHGRPG